MMKNDETRTIWQVAGRSLRGRCPNCGEGHLFAGYLKQVEHCEICNEAWGHIRADDGPAWLTILIVGHVLAPFMLAIIPGSTWPDWVSMTLWPSVALILMLSVLPMAKGLFLGIIWRNQ